MKIAEVRAGRRHRVDMGDLAALAADIRRLGLLSPIGITREGELVFGERRLRACRDILGWREIDVRIVDVPSIAAGEFAENEMRKAFTVSERVAILESMRSHSNGGDRRSGKFQVQDIELEKNGVNAMTCSQRDDEAARRAGLGGRGTAANAKRVVKLGVPELIDAVDHGKIGVATAAELARLEPDAQRAAVADRQVQNSARAKRAARDAADSELKRQRQENTRREPRQITLPWSARTAARMLIVRWPRYLIQDLAAVLTAHLAAADQGQSPEQRRTAQKADARTEAWSLAGSPKSKEISA